MIQEAYCSKEVSKLLKEKGFNELVHHEYHYIITVPQFHKKKHNFNGEEYANCCTEWFSAPTHQMAMAWMREVHNINVNIWYNNSNYAIEYFEPNTQTGVGKFVFIGDGYHVYEDAVEAALKYVLENLI